MTKVVEVDKYLVVVQPTRNAAFADPRHFDCLLGGDAQVLDVSADRETAMLEEGSEPLVMAILVIRHQDDREAPKCIRHDDGPAEIGSPERPGPLHPGTLEVGKDVVERASRSVTDCLFEFHDGLSEFRVGRQRQRRTEVVFKEGGVHRPRDGKKIRASEPG